MFGNRKLLATYCPPTHPCVWQNENFGARKGFVANRLCLTLPSSKRCSIPWKAIRPGTSSFGFCSGNTIDPQCVFCMYVTDTDTNSDCSRTTILTFSVYCVFIWIMRQSSKVTHFVHNVETQDSFSRSSFKFLLRPISPILQLANWLSSVENCYTNLILDTCHFFYTGKIFGEWNLHRKKRVNHKNGFRDKIA